MSARAENERILIASFRDFIANHPPLIVNRHLRILLMDFVRTNSPEGLPSDFDRYLIELEALFDLLDLAHDFQTGHLT